MSFLDILRTAFFALRGNWMRSALTSLGVIIGIAAVIVMVSIGQGTQAEIDKIEKAWGVYAKKVPLTGSDYSMDHTATVYLLDSKGHFQGTIAYQEDDATAVQKLRNLVAKG